MKCFYCGLEHAGECDMASREPKLTLPTAEALAKAFAARLLADIGREKLAEAVRLNMAEQDGRICHTHDFCDANCSMADALAEFGIEEGYTEDPKLIALWNEAWGMAKHDGFYLKAVEPVSTAKHSMIPWYFDDSTSCVYSENGLRIADPYCEGQQSEMSDEVVEANAQFIVRACNSHAELVDVVRGLLAQLEGPVMVHGDGRGRDGKKTGLSGDEFNALRDERIAKAKAAIARAEGGAR